MPAAFELQLVAAMAGALHDAALHGAALHVVTLLTVTTDDADDDESCVCDVRSGEAAA